MKSKLTWWWLLLSFNKYQVAEYYWFCVWSSLSRRPSSSFSTSAEWQRWVRSTELYLKVSQTWVTDEVFLNNITLIILESNMSYVDSHYIYIFQSIYALPYNWIKNICMYVYLSWILIPTSLQNWFINQSRDYKILAMHLYRVNIKIYYWPNFLAPTGNFSLTAGVNAVLSQLQLVCTQKKQFRALNLDIECPPSLPELTQCQCLTKDKEGDLISKVDGKISFDVSKQYRDYRIQSGSCSLRI